MGQTIECTECHDIIDLEARTISIPYVCGKCANENENENENEEAEASDAQAKADLNAYILDIEKQLQSTNIEGQWLSIQNLSLKRENEALTQDNADLTSKLSRVRQDLKSALDIAAHLASV